MHGNEPFSSPAVWWRLGLLFLRTCLLPPHMYICLERENRGMKKGKFFSLRRSQMGKRMTNSCPGRKRAAAAEVGMGKNSLLRGESGGGRRRRRGIGPAEERVEVHKMTKFNNSRKRFSCLEERLLEAALFLLDRNPLEWFFVPLSL